MTEKKGEKLAELLRSKKVVSRETFASAFDEEGGDVHATYENRCTLAHLACLYGHEEIALFLLEKGASATVQNSPGLNVIGYAALFGMESLVRFVGEKRPLSELSAPSRSGMTPLHYASMGEHASIVQYLFEKGVDKSAKTKYGRTPLDVARDYGGKAIVDMFTAHGAVPTLESLSLQ